MITAFCVALRPHAEFCITDSAHSSCSQVGYGELFDFLFEFGKPFAQLDILSFGTFSAGRQVCIVAPPVQTDLLGLIDRANQQTNLQRSSSTFANDT